MKVSTRGDYAARALLSLALHGTDRPTSVKEIAERTRLPQPYLEQILLAVKGAGLVRSKRGVGGGYVLARPPSQITLAEIVAAVEGPQLPLADHPDHCEGHCILQEVWVVRVGRDPPVPRAGDARRPRRADAGRPPRRHRTLTSQPGLRSRSSSGSASSTVASSAGSGSSNCIEAPVAGWTNASCAAWRNGRTTRSSSRCPP